MNNDERRKWFNKLCYSSHHVHRQGCEGQQNAHSSKDCLASKVAPVSQHQMYDQLRVEKEAMVNLLCRQSITCLEKRLKNKIEAKGRKSVNITNTEAQRMDSGTVRSSGNENITESSLSHKQTPQKGSSCLKRAKKKLFHPDIEPDDDEEDEVHCNCCTCKKVGRNLEEKMVSEPQNKVMPSCRPKEQMRRLEFPSQVTSIPKELQTKVYRKRKIDENNDFTRDEKRLKLDLLDISTFEPRACSTPYINKYQGNPPLFCRPPKKQLPPQTQSPMLGTPQPPSTAKIQDLRVKTPRLLTIKDFSQVDESDVISYLPSNKPCNIEANENITRTNDDQKYVKSVNDDSSEEESKLNRTFTVSPNKGSSSPMFTSSSATPFEIPVIDSSPNSPTASLSPQKLPPPQPSAPQLSSSKRSDAAAGSASSNSPSFRRVTRSVAKCHKSYQKISVCLNEASSSKSSCHPAESTEKQSMLPMATSSTPKQSHIEKEETELLDWCVIHHGSSFLLSGYIYDTINRKFVKVEPGTIATRHRASLIETSDGKLYRLMNKFVKSRSNIADASEYFKNGFPENWKEVLDEVVDRKTVNGEVPENKPKRVTRVKEVKKHNRSLNSSFFDLPEGKGTPETPLRREDLRQTRKSGRFVVPPLAYWKNQRIMVDPRTNETLIIDGGRNFLDTKVVHFVG